MVKSKTGKRNENRGESLIAFKERKFGEGDNHQKKFRCYDFDHDGKKEIIIAGGNKKDTLELCVFQLDFDLDFDKNEPKKIFEINDGYKSYVNEKDEICTIDYKDNISIYSLKEIKK